MCELTVAPSSRSFSAQSCTASAMSQMASSAPSSAKTFAVANPMLSCFATPVTRATLPSTLPLRAMLSRSLGVVCTRRPPAGDGRGACYAAAPEGAKAGAPGAFGARRPRRRYPPKPPRTANGMGVLVKLLRGIADARRTSGRCGRGSVVATVREGPEAVWLRVGDVANLLGVSPNTVRRWTDVGPDRRPPQPRRPSPLPRRRRPRPPAARRGRRHRAARRLRRSAPADAGPALHAEGRAGPHVAAGRGPARGAGRGRARPLQPHGGAALRRLLHRRRPAAAGRLPRRRRARPRPPRGGLEHRRLGAGGGRPGVRAGDLPAGHRQGPEPPRPAGDAAARLPLARLGALGAARRRSSERSSSATPATATSPSTPTCSRVSHACAPRRSRSGAPSTSSRTATRACASWSSSHKRSRRPTTSSASSCASRSGC